MLLSRTLCHNCTYQSENCIEFRKCGIDEGVGEYVVTLADADDAVCAYLALTDGGQHADKTYEDSDTENLKAERGICTHLSKHDEEGDESINALCGRNGGKDHVVSRAFRSLLECSFGSVAGDCGSVGAAYTCQGKHCAESDVTEDRNNFW